MSDILSRLHETGERVAPSMDHFLVRHADVVTYSSAAMGGMAWFPHLLPELQVASACLSIIGVVVGVCSQIYVAIARVRLMRRSKSWTSELLRGRDKKSP